MGTGQFRHSSIVSYNSQKNNQQEVKMSLVLPEKLNAEKCLFVSGAGRFSF